MRVKMPSVKRQASNVVKYGLGVFVKEPAPAEEMPAGFAISAPAGVLVDVGEEEAAIRIPAGFVSEEPVRVVACGRGRLAVEAGERSSARVLEEASGERDLAVLLSAAPGARVRWTSLHEGVGADIVRREARLEAAARVEWNDCVLGSGFARAFTTTRLSGEGAEVSARGVFFGAGHDEYDLAQEAVHEAPRTVSSLSVRGALGGEAKAVFRGMIRVPKGMAGCSGRQEAHGLLLSKGAEFDSVPRLEIANDDIRCSHAASVARPDEEKLFYLMSRGLSREESVRAVVLGFLGLEDEALSERVMEKLAV